MQAIYMVLLLSAFTISTMASLTQKGSGGSGDSGDSALNYLNYRDAVVAYAESHTLVAGQIPLASLSLPASWLPASEWSNQIVGNVVYIWGQLSSGGKKKLEQITYCSQAYFYSQGSNTRAICTNTTGPTLPNNLPGLPNSTVVSAIEVN